MWPRDLERWFIFFGIEFRIVGRRQHTEYILGYHFYYFGVNWLNNCAFHCRNVVDEFVQRSSFYLKINDKIPKNTLPAYNFKISNQL